MTSIEAFSSEGLRWRGCTGNSAPASESSALCPEDADLARTIAEHVHCGEPMQLVNAADLPITAPLMILTAETVLPEAAETTVRTYRCSCGFTLDSEL
ncbi:hypothetical protein [Crystallibacter degradans]|uniref:hypothetical protein n=1 Tax=Crystallibacter degradans TaxID=2726743 RepID=UPI001475BCD4|nr:hypothetical protein [Arthrobacter sp. SF27]NMR28160.1 hypothetical protein [Arthrobacter sp. SF27]